MRAMRGGLYSAFLIASLAASSFAFAQDQLLTLVLKGNLTTGSQLFPNPDSPNPIERSQFIPLKNLFGVGAELKFSIPESHFVVGLSGEYIRTTATSSSPGSIPVEDGYRVLPIELTGYFIIPVSGPVVDLYMGGGGGMYFGRRIYRLAGVEAGTVDPGTGFGIHVLGGAGVRVREWLTLIGEMKFRDVQFETTNAFSVSHIVHNGNVVAVSTEPFSSSIHTDGVVFQLGLAITIL